MWLSWKNACLACQHWIYWARWGTLGTLVLRQKKKKAPRSGIQDHLQLLRELKASLSCMISCLKSQTKQWYVVSSSNHRKLNFIYLFCISLARDAWNPRAKHTGTDLTTGKAMLLNWEPAWTHHLLLMPLWAPGTLIWMPELADCFQSASTTSCSSREHLIFREESFFSSLPSRPSL